MNIVIMGGGKVGETLCRFLTEENHEIKIIETDEEVLNELLNNYDIGGIMGNGATFDTQMDAEVDKCDVFIAVTESDETNIVAAITAKKIGARYTVARVRNPEYSGKADFLRDSMGITMMINPEKEASDTMMRMLNYPTAINVESMGHGKIDMVEVEIGKSAPMIGKKLKDYGEVYGKIMICIVIRNGEVMIADGETTLCEGDFVTVTGAAKEVKNFCTLVQEGPARIHSVFIVGGGRVANYLVPRLLNNHVIVKVLEIDPQKADILGFEFPKAEIILGDGTKHKLLAREHFESYDALIALTGIDEENILLSLYANKMGVEKTITKVNRRDLLQVLDHVGLESIITPHQIIANYIVQFVRSTANSEGNNLEKFKIIADGQVEILTFKVNSHWKSEGIPIKLLEINDDALIVCILRGNDIIFPRGDDTILNGDEIIIATTVKGFQDLDEIIKTGGSR